MTPRLLPAAAKETALRLYAETARADRRNRFFSPASIYTTMAMVADTTRGNTQAEIHRLLGWEPASMLGVRRELSDYTVALAGGRREGIDLNMANGLWVAATFPIAEKLAAELRQDFAVELASLDFAGDAEGSRAAINRWVEAKTRDMIRDLLGPGTIDPLTTMVLANAIYFKGEWDARFDEAYTREQPFRLEDGGRATVEMMGQPTRKFPYLEDPANDVQVLELPYRGRETSMVVFLPGRQDGLAHLERQFTVANLSRWLSGLAMTGVNVSLPKFELEYKWLLNSALQALGVRDAFGSLADFGPLSPTLRPGAVQISQVIHKARVKVHEEGTEAAAATAIVTTRGWGPQRPSFVADKPFAFVIYDRPADQILFMGRMMNPNEGPA